MSTLPPPLDTLDPADRAILNGYLEPVEMAPGTRLFDAGDQGESCYLIDEGAVRLEVPFEEVDTDATLAFVEQGELLGELALLDGAPRSAHATAETAVAARQLSRAALDRLGAEHPTLAASLLRALGQDLARKLRTTNDRLAGHLAGDARDAEVDRLVAAATAAQRSFAEWEDARVDALLEDLAGTLGEQAEAFAAATVEATHIGNVADKTIKNRFAALGVWQQLQASSGPGAPGGPSTAGVTELAAPVGVVVGLIPVTNPLATAVYKTLIALKGRNALILSFHRVCLPLAAMFTDVVSEVLAAHGAPPELVQSVRSRSSRHRTARLMSHEDVDFVLATGGPGMVRAAYRSGTPAIGVGPGNAPTWIAADADLEQAAQAVVVSKSFDNGLICGAEHNLVVDATVATAFSAALEAAGAAVLTPEEAARFRTAAVTEDGSGFRPELTGQAASLVAELLQITRSFPIRLLVVPAEPDLADPITSEKMGAFLSSFTVRGDDEALALSAALLTKMGTGHTAIVHTRDEDRAARFAQRMPASRVLINSPGSQGVCGLTTGLTPAFTLGCGTFGGTSTTDNITWTHLINIKRAATFRPPADTPVA